LCCEGHFAQDDDKFEKSHPFSPLCLPSFDDFIPLVDFPASFWSVRLLRFDGLLEFEGTFFSPDAFSCVSPLLLAFELFQCYIYS